MKRRRTPQGRRSTAPAPSIQELLGVVVTPRDAYRAGHQAALFDQLNDSLKEAYRVHDQRKLEELPLSSDGARDRRIRSDDDAAVVLPLWAFDVLYDLFQKQMLKESRGRNGGQTARWWQKYREDLIHWHRYALYEQAIREQRAKPGDDAYELVAEELEGTAFAAQSDAIKRSVEKVVKPALKNGEHARFYRSHAARVYEYLLNLPAPFLDADADLGVLLLKSTT